MSNAQRTARPWAAAGIVDGMDHLFRAAQAVVGAMREAQSRTLRAALRVDTDNEAASRVRDAMVADASPRATSFWPASGDSVIDAVVTVTGADRPTASLLAGAAMNAIILANGDLNATTVTALASGAATWERGRTFGEATTGAMA